MGLTSLTLKQCSQMAGGQSESTTRYYRDKYEEYFQVTSGEGRNRRYSEETVSLLVFISKLYKDGLESPQVKEALEKRYAPVATADLVTLSVFKEELEKRDAAILQLQEELASVKETLLNVEDLFRRTESMDREIMEVISTRYKQQDKDKSFERGKRVPC